MGGRRRSININQGIQGNQADDGITTTTHKINIKGNKKQNATPNINDSIFHIYISRVVRLLAEKLSPAITRPYQYIDIYQSQKKQINYLPNKTSKICFTVERFSPGLQPGLASPNSSRNQVPVHAREHILLHVEETHSGLFLVFEEAFSQHSVILKFCQHKFSISSEDGAGGVTIILGCWSFSVQDRFQIPKQQQTVRKRQLLDEDLSLRKQSSCCFRAGKTCAVSGSPDVVVLGVPQIVFVDFNEACSISYSRICQEFRSNHGRHDVEQVEALSFSLISLQVQEHSSSLVLLDFDELSLIVGLDIVFSCYFFKSFRIFGDTEMGGWDLIEVRFEGQAGISPSAGPKIQDFLGGTSTFNWRFWLGEDSFSASEVSAKLAHLFGVFIAVDGGHRTVGIIKCLFGSLDGIPVESDPDTHYQMIVCIVLARPGLESVAFRLDLDDLVRGQSHISWNDVLHGPDDNFFGAQVATNHSKPRLIIVDGSRVEDADVLASVGPHEVGADVESTAAAAKDADFCVDCGEHIRYPGKHGFPDESFCL